MWSARHRLDVMKRIAAPMVGGAVTSLILELLVYPVIYYLWRSRELDPSLQPTQREILKKASPRVRDLNRSVPETAR